MKPLPSPSGDSSLGVPEFPEKSCQNNWNPQLPGQGAMRSCGSLGFTQGRPRFPRTPVWPRTAQSKHELLLRPRGWDTPLGQLDWLHVCLASPLALWIWIHLDQLWDSLDGHAPEQFLFKGRCSDFLVPLPLGHQKARPRHYANPSEPPDCVFGDFNRDIIVETQNAVPSLLAAKRGNRMLPFPVAGHKHFVECRASAQVADQHHPHKANLVGEAEHVVDLAPQQHICLVSKPQRPI